jgi:membrane fusion protein (multidrug efflux system)
MGKGAAGALAVLVLSWITGTIVASWPDGGPLISVAAAQQPSRPAVPVEAARVEVGTITDEVLAVGSLRSNESVIIRPEIAGRITGINFSEGEPTRSGALLFALDDAIYQADLNEAEASLLLGQRNYERATELYKKGAGTARNLDEAEAALQTDRARVALARARLEKTRISAPFDGILGLRHVSIGDYVIPGQDLVNLENIDPIKVDFRVPERFLSGLAKGQELRVKVDAFPGRAFEGEVYALDPRVDSAGRSVAVRARVPNSDRVLRPGLFARVNLAIESRKNALIVPEQAIVPRGDERFVFKVVDGKAVMTKVILGQRRGGRVEIVEGLEAGDVVVTAGQIKIRDGAPVKVVGEGTGA